MSSKKSNSDISKTVVIDEHNKRDFYLGLLDDAINKLHYKATKGRIKDTKNEKVRIDIYRALFYGVNTANTVFKDKQVDSLVMELERLKKIYLNSDGSNAKDSVELTTEDLEALDSFNEEVKRLKNNELNNTNGGVE